MNLKGLSSSPNIGIKTLELSYPWLTVGLGLVIVMVVAIIATGVGSVNIPPITVVKIILNRLPFYEINQTWPESWETILWELRVPRVLLASIVGASLALSGATYQSLFRNPLADPYLIGVAAGAGLGATIVLVTAVPIFIGGFNVLPLAAFLGAIGTVLLSYSIALRMGGLPLTTLILAGVAVSYFAGALTSLMMLLNNPDVKPLLGWLMGGLSSSNWNQVKLVLPYWAIGTIVMMAYMRVLNLFQVGEQQAKQLGVNVERAKLILIAAASLATAAAVSVSGLIGFVGLVAPHAVRLVWRHDHRFLIPMSMIVGASFLVISDLVARTVLPYGELPVGVITGFCGAPFFLYILHRTRSQGL